MSIKIIKPGLVSTLVDEGRTGYRSLGIGPGGVMDSFAMEVANYLVGNSQRSATLEMHFPAPEILFQQAPLVCLTGKGFSAWLNDIQIPLWQPFRAMKDSVLKFKISPPGHRTYLAVRGGWRAQEWLGSFATYLGVQAGGHEGRTLQKDDILEATVPYRESDVRDLLPLAISKGELDSVYGASNQIRCTPSAETDLLSDQSRNIFLSSSFTVTSQSNRMGYRLKGHPMHLGQPTEMVSSPVDFGSVQLLPEGNLIVLMADHQTTGGYPRIASVIQADLPKMAQLSPGEEINFRMISFSEAESALFSRRKQLDDLKSRCLSQFTP
jgi:antagonist of KipI